jgi:DNA-binding NarL/FixJ family response regulator
MAFGDIANDPQPARLLIVEDDVLLASAVQELLRDSGFEVVGTAGSAAAAVSLAKDQNPQLALIDICLVGPIDGIELACRLRDEYRIPTIFLSGLTDPEVRERALIADPLGFIRKPYRASQVYNAIEQALHGQLST